MNSLNDICYEQIKNNFWYGIFGDFKLIIDKETGFFNATKLCKSGGKLFKNWTQNKNSKELIEYYNRKRSGQDSSHFTSSLYENNIAGSELNNIISGTYVRKELFLAISIWISYEFYGKCYKIIEDYFIADFKSGKEDFLERKLKDVENKLEKLTFENYVAPTKDDAKIHHFVLIHINDKVYQYYVLRIQKCNMDSRIDEILDDHKESRIVLNTQNPNSINLYNRMKEEYKIKYNMTWLGNYFNIDLDEMDLIEEIIKLTKY